MKRIVSLLLALVLLFSLAVPTFAEPPIPEPPEEQITDYYDEDLPDLNDWKDAPRTYTVCADADDVENNQYSSFSDLLRDRFLFPGDTVVAHSSSSTVWYLMLRGEDSNNERYVGITDRFATGEGLNTYSFGAETIAHNCYRKIVLDKLNGVALMRDSFGGSEAGPTNESPDTEPYHRCSSVMVTTTPLTRAVTYDLFGGKLQYGENTTQVRISNENQTLYTYSPVKEGFHFTGWNYTYWVDNGDGTGKCTIGGHLIGDLRLNATYFNGDTAKFIAGEGATIHCLPELIIELEGETDISGYIPKREGYVFQGWYDNKQFTGEPITMTSDFPGYCLRLYAKWGSVSSPEITWIVDGEETKETYALGELPVFKGSTDKPDSRFYTYEFTGWDKPIVAAAADTTYTAQYMASLIIKEPDNRFTDVPQGKWYYNDTYTAVGLGLFGGVAEDEFAPDSPMTRAMMVTVLWRIEGEPPCSVLNTFDDVETDKWYSRAIDWAASNEIVKGISETTFSPNGNITREQMAVILMRYSQSRDFDTSARADLSAFPDGDKVSGWANAALAWANAEGLIGGTVQNGVTVLDPQGNATRAQVATILIRYLKSVA